MKRKLHSTDKRANSRGANRAPNEANSSYATAVREILARQHYVTEELCAANLENAMCRTRIEELKEELARAEAKLEANGTLQGALQVDMKSIREEQMEHIRRKVERKFACASLSPLPSDFFRASVMETDRPMELLPEEEHNDVEELDQNADAFLSDLPVLSPQKNDWNETEGTPQDSEQHEAERRVHVDANGESAPTGAVQIEGEQPLELSVIGIASQVGENHAENATAAEAPQNGSEGLSSVLQQILVQILGAEPVNRSQAEPGIVASSEGNEEDAAEDAEESTQSDDGDEVGEGAEDVVEDSQQVQEPGPPRLRRSPSNKSSEQAAKRRTVGVKTGHLRKVGLDELRGHTLRLDEYWNKKTLLFACPLCEMRARRSHVLHAYKHLLDHLGETAYFAYKCLREDCDYRSMRASSVQQHLKSKHGLEWTEEMMSSKALRKNYAHKITFFKTAIVDKKNKAVLRGIFEEHKQSSQ